MVVKKLAKKLVQQGITCTCSLTYLLLSLPLIHGTACFLESTVRKKQNAQCESHTSSFNMHAYVYMYYTSVVMTIQDALGLMVTSPVISPTS